MARHDSRRVDGTTRLRLRPLRLWNSLEHRGRKADPFYRIRRLLTSASNVSATGAEPASVASSTPVIPTEKSAQPVTPKTVRGIYEIDRPAVALRYTLQLADDLQDESCPPEVNKLGRAIGRWCSLERQATPQRWAHSGWKHPREPARPSTVSGATAAINRVSHR